MATLPAPPTPTLTAIWQSYVDREAKEPRRGHLGASVIGRPCERQLWYAFRWAYQEQFEGRMLRLFERGHREEDWVARDLRATGATVHQVDPRTGQQFRLTCPDNAHISGSMDGCIIGLKEAPKTWHVWECKTHNAKSFANLVKDGVKVAKPEHWAQMQLYMRWSGMTRALYTAVNKDTDALHLERIRVDKEAGARLEARAIRIVNATEPPPGISTDPAHWQCKFCPAYELCFGAQMAAVNARTCIHATPEPDGTWTCAKCGTISEEQQAKPCPHHLYIPALVKHGKPVDADPDNNTVTYETPDGRTFKNGNHGAAGEYTSEELRVMDPAMICDEGADRLRTELGARHVKPSAAKPPAMNWKESAA